MEFPSFVQNIWYGTSVGRPFTSHSRYIVWLGVIACQEPLPLTTRGKETLIRFYGKSYFTRIQGNLFFFQNLTWEYIHLPSPGHFTNPTGVVATVSDIDVRFPYWWRHKNSSVGLLDVSGNLELSVVNITTSVLPGKVTAIQWPVLTGQVYSVLRGHPVPVYLWTFLQCHCQRQSNHSNFQKYKGMSIPVQ